MLGSPPMTAERHGAFAESLGKEARVLVVVRDELYNGSWDELVADLAARQQKKPFIFKLNTKIDEDLDRIATLRAYEEEHQVNLREFLGLAAGSDEEGLPL